MRWLRAGWFGIVVSGWAAIALLAVACSGSQPIHAGELPEVTPSAAGGELSVESRIGSRTFPSVFQAWNPADNLDEGRTTTLTRHDLVWESPDFFELDWESGPQGLAKAFTASSIKRARKRREELLARNPKMIMLAEIRWHDAPTSFLPEGHPWWALKDGKPIVAWEEGHFYLLDIHNPDLRHQVAAQCKAVVDTGVLDGVMLDWWEENDDRVELIKEIRATIGDKALILVNANDHTTPRSAAFVNGFFMECYRSKTVEDWKRIGETLDWAESHLRTPRIDCLETWYHKSRKDLNLMRATTALSLTHSDGYCLFSDPNPLPTPDHLHDWYPFWNKSLGKAVSAGVLRKDGASEREFEHGTAVYNPMGNPAVTVRFESDRRSLATGKVAREHVVEGCDGDLFLTP